MVTNCLHCIHCPQVDDSEDLRGGWAVCKKGFDVQYWTRPKIPSGGSGLKHMSVVRDGSDCPLYDTGEYEGPRPSRLDKILQDGYPL